MPNKRRREKKRTKAALTTLKRQGVPQLQGGGTIPLGPINGQPATHGNGSTLGFAAQSPEQCDAFHAAGIANGGTTCEEPPGFRDGAVGKLYLAYLRDPDGNKICALPRPAK